MTDLDLRRGPEAGEDLADLTGNVTPAEMTARIMIL